MGIHRLSEQQTMIESSCVRIVLNRDKVSVCAGNVINVQTADMMSVKIDDPKSVVCVCICLSLASDSSEILSHHYETWQTASDIRMHHVLIILTLTFIQGHILYYFRN